MLPITGGHLYLGYRPEYVRKNYQEIVAGGGGAPRVWQDVIWEFLATGDPDAALANYRADNSLVSEEGESRAHTFHWIRHLAALGTVDTSVTADSPLAMTFVRNGNRTYVAANVGDSSLTVTFSTGVRLTVAPGETGTTGASTWSGGAGRAGGAPATSPSSATTSPPISSPSTTARRQHHSTVDNTDDTGTVDECTAYRTGDRAEPGGPVLRRRRQPVRAGERRPRDVPCARWFHQPRRNALSGKSFRRTWTQRSVHGRVDCVCAGGGFRHGCRQCRADPGVLRLHRQRQLGSGGDLPIFCDRSGGGSRELHPANRFGIGHRPVGRAGRWHRAGGDLECAVGPGASPTVAGGSSVSLPFG